MARRFHVTARALEARKLAIELMLHYGLGDWQFAFSGAKTRCGRCRYPTVFRRGVIELGVHLCEHAPFEEIKDTILHEIAHALVGAGHGHDHVWKRKCIEIGARPERCAEEAYAPQGRYVATCGSCGKEYDKHRAPKRGRRYWCGLCGRAHPLSFVDTKNMARQGAGRP